MDALSAAENPIIIEDREELIFMLCEAAELEHMIMLQYLFAAFSLKRDEARLQVIEFGLGKFAQIRVAQHLLGVRDALAGVPDLQHDRRGALGGLVDDGVVPARHPPR